MPSRSRPTTPRPRRSSWLAAIGLALSGGAILALGACAPSVTLAPEDPGFPRMSPAQVEAEAKAVAEQPVLQEWWGRFVKAWCKADGLDAAECAP